VQFAGHDENMTRSIQVEDRVAASLPSSLPCSVLAAVLAGQFARLKLKIRTETKIFACPDLQRQRLPAAKSGHLSGAPPIRAALCGSGFSFSRVIFRGVSTQLIGNPCSSVESKSLRPIASDCAQLRSFFAARRQNPRYQQAFCFARPATRQDNFRREILVGRQGLA
jgi:hypothetical protein